MKEFFKYYAKTFKDVVKSEPILATLILSIFSIASFIQQLIKLSSPKIYLLLLSIKNIAQPHLKLLKLYFSTPTSMSP